MHLTHPHGIAPDCLRINSVVRTIGDKWSVMIVMVLIMRPHRFNEMKRVIGGISQQMLARTLRALERDGLIARTVHATVPPQVEYALTDLGCSLAEPILAIGTWAQMHIDEVEKNRASFDGRPS
jgi:DNA-binding HxlR family transcriptional regulator